MAFLRSIALRARRHLPEKVADRVIERAVATYGRVFSASLPETRFAIIMQGRAGSALLCDLLDQHSAIRCQTDELLEKPVSRPIEYLNGMACYYNAGAWGVKIKLSQIEHQPSVDNPVDFLHELRDEGFKLFSLTRRNAFLGTLSVIAAYKRGKYHRIEARPNEAFRRISITDPAYFVKKIGERERARVALLKATAGLTDMDLCYEDDLLEPERQRQASYTLFSHLGLEPMNVESSFKRIAGPRLSDTVTNAEELWKAVENSPYAGFLSEVSL